MGEPNPPYTGSPYSAYAENPGQPYGAPYPAQPVYGLPVSAVPVTAPLMGSEPVIAQIGEIQVTSTTVRTPAGQFPLRGSRWDVHDQWMTEQKTPTWAIVMVVVGFFIVAFFSLLFLLAKETVYRGTVQVRVGNGPYSYVCRIPVTNPFQVQQIYQQVNYVRSLSMM